MSRIVLGVVLASAGLAACTYYEPYPAVSLVPTTTAVVPAPYTATPTVVVPTPYTATTVIERRIIP